MAAIPLSSFLGAASQVVTGLMQGKAAGEAAAAEQAQQQQELAMRQAQNRQQQEQFLQTLNLHQQQFENTKRHQQEEERLRGVDIARREKADQFKRDQAPLIAAGKAQIAGAKSAQEAWGTAQRLIQEATDNYNRNVLTMDPADRQAAADALQTRIEELTQQASAWGTPWTMGQQPGAMPTTPPAAGTPPATATTPAGTAAAQPKPSVAVPTHLTPAQQAAKGRLAQGAERIAETKKEHGIRHVERQTGFALTKRGQDLAASGRTTSHEDRQALLDLRKQHEKWLETHPRGGRDPQVAATREATRLEAVMGSDKWGKMDPRMRQSLWERYQTAVKTAGEKVNPSIQSFVKDTVSAPPLAKGKTDKFAGRRLTLALRTLNEVDPMTGTLKHNPVLPEQLTVRAPAFATAYKTYGPEGQAMMQQEYPKDYQYYLQTQPKPAAKPAPAPAPPPAAPRAAGGPPVLPPASDVSVSQPAAPTAPPAPPATAPAPPRAQPAPPAKPTKQATVHGGYDYSTKQGVPPPKGEDPAVWTAVRRMKPPYPQGTPEWGVWQLFIGQGVEPKAILSALKSNPQAMEIARATLHDINQNFLSGPRAAAMQKAAGEGVTKGTATKPTTPGGIQFDASVPSSWQRISWPQGTTGVQMTSPGMGVMTVGKARYSFHLKGGKPRIDARL